MDISSSLNLLNFSISFLDLEQTTIMSWINDNWTQIAATGALIVSGVNLWIATREKRRFKRFEIYQEKRIEAVMKTYTCIIKFFDCSDNILRPRTKDELTNYCNNLRGLWIKARKVIFHNELFLNDNERRDFCYCREIMRETFEFCGKYYKEFPSDGDIDTIRKNNLEKVAQMSDKASESLRIIKHDIDSYYKG